MHEIVKRIGNLEKLAAMDLNEYSDFETRPRYQCGHVFCCNVVATGLPKDSLPYLVSNGVSQFNTYEFQINKDDLPPTTRDDLKRTQDYDIGKLLNPTFSITNPDHLYPLFVPFSSPVNADEKPRIAPNVHVEPNRKRRISIRKSFRFLMSA
ncbi:hypothetical protein V6N12_011789 [Hibiscus sabdariffa]|uniref:Uncharacterized protein n=1 Tax=Hibiscus sabdariffa TaxID=183260 RepID=A0ABR2BTG0_9ROSI